jgi:Spy/CpxP family protein refolding chaperone
MKTSSLAAKVFTTAVFLATSALAAGTLADGTDLDALRAAVRADKHALVAQTLQLTPDEAKRFWPIYDAYQRDLDMINRERNITVIDVVETERPISNLYARNLEKSLISADEAEIKSRRTCYNKVMKALPAKKAARYLQLESKIRAAQAYDIAAAIPLVK